MSDTKASRKCYEKTIEVLKDFEKRSSVVTDKDKEIINNMHEIVVEKSVKEWLEDSFFKRIEKDFNKHEFIQPNDEVFDNPLLNDLFHDSLLRGMFAMINWVQTHQQEVYKIFTEMNAFSMLCIKPYPFFKPSLTEEQFAALEEAIEKEGGFEALEEAVIENHKEKVRRIFEADGKNIENRERERCSKST